MRQIYIVLGSVSLGLAVLGILLPLVPATPFLLLSAAFYARGSKRFYNWLINHKWFGSHIRNYRSGAGVELKYKIAGIVTVWFSIILTSVFATDELWIRALLVLVGLGISLYLLSIPTVKNKAH